MSADGAAASHAADAGVALIVALGIERACFERCAARSAATLSVRQCGPGAGRAAAAAALAVRGGAAALISCGLAGALRADVEPGCVLLPRSVVGSDGTRFDVDAGWRERLSQALRARHTVDDRPLLASSEVLATPAAKRQAAQASGAVAVDMESGAVAAAAMTAGVPFVVLRVAADGAADTLPPGVERWIDEAGERRLAPVVDAALRPGSWPILWTLARRYRRARRTLIEVAGELTPRGFLFHA
ncbi:MAG: phosphorylase [Gammaproteobacteria bacterium]|nr:phosphorylase [Gammaproteobacteria bacterium]